MLILKRASPTALLSNTARVVYGLSRAQAEHAEMMKHHLQRQQAAEMNEEFHQLLAARMQPVRDSVRHTRMPIILHAGRPSSGDDIGLFSSAPVPPPLLQGSQVPMGYDEGMVRMAHVGDEIGRELAHLNKEAGIGDAFKRLGSSISNFAKNKIDSIAMGGKSVGLAPHGYVKPLGPKPPGLKDKIVGSIDRLSNKIDAKQPAPKANPLDSLKSWESQAKTEMKPSSSQTYRTPSTSTPPAATPAPQATNTSSTPTTTPSATPASSSAPSTWDRLKGEFSGGKWKGTALGLGAAAAGAYGLYQGTKGILNWARKETPPTVYNEGSAMPAAGVNEYGAPDRSLPFRF